MAVKQHRSYYCLNKQGRQKRLYRDIDFKRYEFDGILQIETIEYDPNRTSFIALLCYATVRDVIY